MTENGHQRKISRIAYAGDAGNWEILRSLPHPSLAPHVIGYSGYRESCGKPVWRRELPVSFIPVIINFDAPFILRERRMAEARYESFAAGIYTQPVMVGSTGSAYCLQVNFSPLGALQFFGAAQSEIAGRTLSLSDLLGSSADLLIHELHDAADWTKRFALLDRFIARRFEHARAPHDTVRAVWHQFKLSKGAASIASLAKEAGISRRHLAKLFRAEIGTTPKTMARILRFEHACHMSKILPRQGWADIAYEAGYADQAHLAREFKELSGLSPSDLWRRDRAETGVLESNFS
jgi:AraC-like DNA-binding protein